MYKIFVMILIFITLLILVSLFAVLIKKIRYIVNNKSDSLKLDIVLALIILVLCVILYCHADLTYIVLHARACIDYISSGNIMEFSNNPTYGIPYSIIVYIILALWNLPVLVIGKLINNNFWSELTLDFTSNFLLILYNKLFLIILFGAIAWVIYKIGLLIGLNIKKSKWMAFAWCTSSICLYDLAYGQIDFMGIIFMMLGIYFFLKKDYTKASVLMAMSAMFKSFVLVFYLPLLVLVEKEPLKIIKQFGIAISGWLLCVIFSYIGSGMSWFQAHNSVWLEKLVEFNIETAFGTVSIFFLFFFIALILCYVKKVKDDNEFKRFVIYVPILIFSILFCTINWLANWPVWMAPFLVISMFQVKDFKTSCLIDLGIFIAYITNYTLIFDSYLMGLGVLGKYIYSNPNQSIYPIISLGGYIPQSVFNSLFIAILIANLIVKYPKGDEDNATYINSLSTECIRKNIWIRNIGIVAYIFMSVIMFLS